MARIRSIKTVYLVLYNVLSLLGWLYVLYLTAQHLASPSPKNVQGFLAELWTFLHKPAYRPLTNVLGRTKTLKSAIQPTLKMVQSAAILDLVHVLLGLVRSSPMTTFIQVFSRLYLVYGITERYATNGLYTSMVLAWSVTEVIRYAYYVFQTLHRIPPAWLTYLRYTTFIGLYPIGAASEAFLIFNTLPALGTVVAPSMAGWSVQEWFRAVLFVSWWPGLLNQMSHMYAQRRKHLYSKPGSGSKVGGKRVKKA